MTTHADMQRGLGRRFAPDDRDQEHLIRKKFALPSLRHLPETKRHWSHGWRGDQKDTPSCVGFSIVHKLHAGPITQIKRGNRARPVVDPIRDIYEPAQRIDEWPGENYDGTSVRAGMKIAQQLGFIESYAWAFALEDMIRTLALEPVVVGINWYWDMWEPDKRGRVKLGGPLMGGHAICAIGYSMKREEVDLLQSYGPKYGVNGVIRIGFEDMRRLIAEDGEICLAVECERKTQ